jgi:halimadienyl-diphosphate synthase
MMITIDEEIQKLLKEIGPGCMSNTAYDTAWIARLGEIDWDLSSTALDWLCENQLSDGSWGAGEPFYYHDRVISTLAAMIALTYRGRRNKDKEKIERGLISLDQITSNATRGLTSDANGAPAGFEMIVPTLVAEAELLGIIKQQGERILGRLSRQRDAKLSKIAGIKISRHITTALSAELAGKDSIAMLDIENLQESNGSVGNNPAATAYFAQEIHPGNNAALAYLHTVVKDGGAPFVAPFEIFERLWIIWNIMISGEMSSEMHAMLKPHVDYIENHWRKKQGIGYSSSYTPTDGDDTAIAYEILSFFGRTVDFDAILNYEEKDHFRCFHLEVNPSTDVNIHMLGAFKAAHLEKKHPLVQKSIKFIRKTCIDNKYWLDKWHISPYYTTAHAIILCRGYDDEICKQSVEWLLSSQKADGSWGFYGFSTEEETAYCVQALSIWSRYGGKIPKGRIEQAAFWLKNNSGSRLPSLWIGKSLYCPDLLVKVTIKSALKLAGV